MERPKLEAPQKSAGIDLETGNRVVSIKPGVADLRSVRVGVMQLAYALAKRPKAVGLLALPGTSVTTERLRNEWRLASSALRPDVLNRLSICIRQDQQWTGIPNDPDPETQRIISDFFAGAGPRAGLSLPRPEYWFTVTGLLIHQWLLGKGPMTAKWLMKTAGCSYPTVAAALRRLEHRLVRHSDRRVELRGFPRDEWASLVAISENARSTIRYADRSGQPRSPESLLRRLGALKRKDLAVGGVLGAKHYCPDLDLLGAPRLDISMHCPGKTADLSFIERIDPALTRTELRDESPSVAVHLIRRADPLFQAGDGSLAVSDPVECLLDLHEMRLEVQALEFLGTFPAAKGQV